MKFSCMQHNLQAGLEIATRAAAGKKSTLPVLANILLSATDDNLLTLSATNLEIAIIVQVGCKVEQPGAITVPASTFSDLVKTLPPDRVEMELITRTQTLRLTCGSSKANIKGLDAMEFPAIAESQDGESVTIEPDALKQAINKVAFSAAKDESRLMLTGVLTKFDGDTLTLAAADGFRVSVCEVELESSFLKPFQVLIPAKALTELARILNQEDDVSISLSTTRNQILFHLDNTDLVTQLIDLQFPDYAQIIPAQSSTKVTIGTTELRNAVNAAYIFAREAAGLLKLGVNQEDASADVFKPSSLSIAARSDETGDNASEVDADVDGDSMIIAFNVLFVREWLKSVDASQVTVELTNANSPGVFREVGNPDYVHVIMPMQIGR